MNVIDSSAWIEYLVQGEGESFFRPVIEDVHKRMVLLAGKTRAFEITASMSEGRVIDLDTETAIEASLLSLEHRLAMADSIIYATARRHKATLWTQDVDLSGLPGVKYRAKQKS